MTVAEVKETLQEAGVNLNDAQFEAIQSLLGSGGGGGTDITEITEQNVEEAVEATDYIIVTIGRDLHTSHINEYEDYNTQYYLFYAVINNNTVALPIELLYNFTIKSKPIIGIRNHYDVATYSSGTSDSEKKYRYYNSLVNTVDKFIIIEEDNLINEYNYINSEITPLSVEIYGMPKWIEDQDHDRVIDNSNIGNYRLVSKDFEGLLKHSNEYGEQFPWINSYYIWSTQFTNGLVGIECGVPKWYINDHASFACIYEAYVNWHMRLVGFETPDLYEYENYTMTGQYYGSVYNKLYYVNSFDSSAISANEKYDFINLIKNRFINSLGYGSFNFPYSYDLFYLRPLNIQPYDLSTGYYLENDIEGVHQIPIATDGMIYYFKDKNTDTLLALIFVNREDDKTFKNGDLKYIPWLITYAPGQNPA